VAGFAALYTEKVVKMDSRGWLDFQQSARSEKKVAENWHDD